MTSSKDARERNGILTRRGMITSAAIAVGSLASGAASLAGPRQEQQQKMQAEAMSSGVEGLLTYLHQEVEIRTNPQRVYEALLDSAQFGALTKMTAEVKAEVGAHFSLFGGLILGRNVELVPNQRIVQAWRPASWKPGIYSIAKFEFSGGVNATHIVLDHTGFPEGDFRHLNSGWYDHYWGPLQKYLES